MMTFRSPPETFLEARTSPLAGSHVDAIFYCSGVFNFYSHRSEETEFNDKVWSGRPWPRELAEQGTDSLTLITEWCRAHGVEAFWSMRMNDNHDSGRPELFSDWKDSHRAWLMNEDGPYAKWSWSCLDYAVQGVREKSLRILRDVATRYTLDGLELDFFRHPVYFRPQMLGEAVTDDHRDMLSGLIRRVREMANEVAEQRGRPLLIAVRVPDSLAYCHEIGIDLLRWLQAEWIDIVVGGGYFKLEPWEHLVGIGQRYRVPIYPSFCPRPVEQALQHRAGLLVQVGVGELLVPDPGHLPHRLAQPPVPPGERLLVVDHLQALPVQLVELADPVDPLLRPPVQRLVGIGVGDFLRNHAARGPGSRPG